jgi:hypothetical protein
MCQGCEVFCTAERLLIVSIRSVSGAAEPLLNVPRMTILCKSDVKYSQIFKDEIRYQTQSDLQYSLICYVL